MQRAMVRASRLAPGNGTYLVQVRCHLEEDFDPEVALEAWRRVVRVRLALRCRTQEVDGEPAALVEDPSKIGRARVVESPTEAADALEQDRLEDFDLAAGPPWRVTIARVGLRSWIAALTYHHVLLDGNCHFPLLRDWFGAYEALRSSEEPRFEEERGRQGRVDSDSGADLDFWRGQLAGLDATVPLLIERARQAPPEAGAVSRCGFALSDDETRRAREACEQVGVTESTLLVAAWALVLGRWSDRDDVTMGVVHNGRERGSEIVGMHINTVPFRVRLEAEQTLTDWLRKLRERWLAGREHSSVSFELVQQASSLGPGARLFDTVVAFDREPLEESLRSLGPAWATRRVEVLQRTDQSFTVVAYARPTFRIELVFDRAHYSQRFAQETAARLRTALVRLCSSLDKPLREASVLPADEVEQLESWNPAPTPIEWLGGMHARIEDVAQRLPDRVALASGARETSYAELERRAAGIARRLRASGVDTETPVAVCIDRRPEAVIAIFAVMKAGAPFCVLDRGLPDERLRQMRQVLGARIVLGLSEDQSRFGVDSEWMALEEDETAGTFAVEASARPDLNQPAYAVFTSGSTGEPKAVLVSHRSLCNCVTAAQKLQQITQADRRVQFASVGSDVFLAEIFNYLTCGATLVFGIGEQANSIQGFLGFLERERITAASTPSSYWAQWARLLEHDPTAIPPSLRLVLTGMERVDPAAYAIWKSHTEGRLLWFNAYGPSETTMTSLFHQGGTSEWETRGFVPIGKPIANTRALVLDRNRNLTPIGTAGELWIGGAGVTIGYAGRPELTAERFIRDERAGGDCRLYRTGDRVLRLPDGNLVFLGRTDRQVKIRGYRIELEEVEEALARQPGIERCAVVVCDADRQAWLAAYVAGAHPPGVAELRRELARILPAYMVPRAFTFLEQMPLTASGKVDVTRLPTPSGTVERRELFVEPRTPAERRMATTVAEILSLERVGADDDFFELGGDSMAAVRLLTAIQAASGRTFALADLWGHATVARLAQMTEGENLRSPSLITPFREIGSRRPLFCLHALTGNSLFYRELASELGPEQPVYAVQSVGLSGEEAPLESVEAMATRYIAEIRSIQPQGPYRLAGYCFGAYLAVELASRFEEAGEHVELVVCFDTDGAWRMADSFEDGMRSHVAALRRARGREFLEYLAERIAYRAGRIRSAVQRAQDRIQTQFGNTPAAETLLMRVREANMRASRQYCPRPFRARFVYLRPKERSFASPRAFWSRLAQSGIEERSVPGHGFGMFQQPHVEAVARELDPFLASP